MPGGVRERARLADAPGLKLLSPIALHYCKLYIRHTIHYYHYISLTALFPGQPG